MVLMQGRSYWEGSKRRWVRRRMCGYGMVVPGADALDYRSNDVATTFGRSGGEAKVCVCVVVGGGGSCYLQRVC